MDENDAADPEVETRTTTPPLARAPSGRRLRPRGDARVYEGLKVPKDLADLTFDQLKGRYGKEVPSFTSLRGHEDVALFT